MTPVTLVIGGGFYGCCLALTLHELGHQVSILEREAGLLQRASYGNQARVHNGYHYPRSFMTGWRSHANFPRFVADFPDCIEGNFQKLYAISRQQSKVNAYQFQSFCKNIGSPIEQAPLNLLKLFNPQLIEAVFLVQESAFNADILRAILFDKLQGAGIPILLNTSAQRILPGEGNPLSVELENDQQMSADFVFNCTYAQINGLLTRSGGASLPMKYELAELALVKVPPPLEGLGITVMDGPFFSLMPFPARTLHSLSHVRYTPHNAWTNSSPTPTYLESIKQTPPRSNFPYMIKDAQRYLPALKNAEHRDSLFEIKTLLTHNETDDGRPILFRKDNNLPNLYTVMGGKIDNIYDILQHLRNHFGNMHERL